MDHSTFILGSTHSSHGFPVKKQTLKQSFSLLNSFLHCLDSVYHKRKKWKKKNKENKKIHLRILSFEIKETMSSVHRIINGMTKIYTHIYITVPAKSWDEWILKWNYGQWKKSDWDWHGYIKIKVYRW